MLSRITNKTEGFTIIEILVYVAVLAGIFLLVVNTLLSFTKNYREVRALRLADQTSITALERMTREIREASSANTDQSSVLTLTKTVGSTSTTTKFYIDGGVMKLDVNGEYAGPLSIAGSSVVSLDFTKLSNSTSSLIKIDITVQGTSGPVARTKTYHSSVIMRGL